jgi:integration host factor subunit beta
MTKSELIERLALLMPHLQPKDIELGVRQVLFELGEALEQQNRVEIRGFGSFSVHTRPSRVGRNPKTGESVVIPKKSVPHFKPGKELRERVNALKAEDIRPAGSDDKHDKDDE